MLPTPFTLGVRRRIADGDTRNGRGNPTITYAEATPWKVSGWSPGANETPFRPNRDLSLILWTVYAPADDDAAPRALDRVVWHDGTEYDVEGDPADWTNGPWEHPTAGITVELKRAEG